MTTSSPLRVVFAGTPEFAAAHLSALIQANVEIVGAYTQPDRPAGRGKKLQPGPVKQLAEQHQIPVFQPTTVKSPQEQQQLASLRPDVMVVVAYGLILPQAILDTPRLGCLNVHGSLLPRWRGAAPIQRAIEAGDSETGITIMQMDAGLDTGAMLAMNQCPIGSSTSSGDLLEELASLGAPLLIDVLANLPEYQAQAKPQPDEGTTYAHKILKSESLIDWSKSATELERAVRAFNPFPTMFTHLGGDRLKIWQASLVTAADSGDAPGTITESTRNGIVVACGGGGQLCLTELQLPGGKRLTAQQMLNAKSALFTPGVRLGDS